MGHSEAGRKSEITTMAAALGLAGTILQIGDATARLARFVRALKNVPGELLTLTNEVTELRSVLEDIKEVFDDRKTELQPDGTVRSEKLLKSANQALANIKDVTNLLDRLERSLSKGKQHYRLQYVLQKSNIRAKIDAVRDSRISLMLLLGAHSAMVARDTHMVITSIVTLNNPNEGKKYYHSVPDDNLLAGITDSPVSDDSTYEVFIKRCRIWCSCICHKRSRFDGTDKLKETLGSLFIGYAGSLFQKVKCSEAMCVNNSIKKDFRLDLTYYFPTWFMKKAIQITIELARANHSFVLAVRNVIPLSCEFYIAVQRGYIDRLKYLFSNRLACPNDIGGLYGDTALHDALREGQIESARVLIQARADPTLENDSHVSAIDMAWTQILSKERSAEYLTGLQEVFPRGKHLDDWQLTPTHKIVLGLSLVNLRKMLELSTADVNKKGKHGRTPLWWAVRSDNLEAVSTLLAFNADPNISDYEGFSAMHNSAKRGNLRVIACLLEGGGGGVAEAWSMKQGYPLLLASQSHDNPACILPFIGPGVKLNDDKASHGTSPLHRAASIGFTRTVGLLLDHGANINAPDRSGEVPLFRCFAHDHDQTIQFLLSRGADYTVVTHDGRTILHIAAKWARKPSTIERLREHGLRGINPLHVTNSGSTAAELVGQAEHTEEFKAAFYELLRHLEKAQSQD